MVCGHGVLLCGEDFLVEFLSWAQAGVFDGDVLPRAQACQGDHAPRKVGDANGLAHVEHEDLVSGGHRGGLHHEAACLGDGHEEAGDVGVRNGNRASALYLLAEARDHRPVGAKDVAEAGGDKPRYSLAASGAEGEAKGLYVDLCQALGASHYVCGVDGLVGRYHNHLARAVFHAFVGNVA